MTNGPPGAGKAGFQRSADPPFQSDRGRFNIRHNQRFLPDDDEHQFEELRLQLEVAYASDRNFIEEYYKRLFDTGLDQETLAYGIWQKDNQYANIWTEANLQNWYTDTQWLPRVDYYRLGDSFFDNLFTYYTHSGMDYATIHTDIMVNNPNLFAFMPFDPISNTTGTFSSGRFYTNHELDMPLNFGNVVRFVPYVQGQAVGWTDQLGGGPLGHLPTGAMGRDLGRGRRARRGHGLEEVPQRRERALERPRAQQQDQPLRRRPRGLFQPASSTTSPSRTTSTIILTSTCGDIWPSPTSRAGSCRSPTTRGT